MRFIRWVGWVGAGWLLLAASRPGRGVSASGNQEAAAQPRGVGRMIRVPASAITIAVGFLVAIAIATACPVARFWCLALLTTGAVTRASSLTRARLARWRPHALALALVMAVVAGTVGIALASRTMSEAQACEDHHHEGEQKAETHERQGEPGVRLILAAGLQAPEEPGGVHRQGRPGDAGDQPEVPCDGMPDRPELFMAYASVRLTFLAVVGGFIFGVIATLGVLLSVLLARGGD